MAPEEQEVRPRGESLGQSFQAHTGDVGSSFEERNFTAPEAKKQSRRHWPWVLLILGALLAIFLIYRATRKSAAPAGAGNKTGGGRGQAGPAAITVGEAQTGNINVYVDALGTVTPVATVTLYSQITGVVTAVHYREGQIVRKGDPLVDIDPRPYQATLTQAEGTLLHDQGVLDEARMDMSRYQSAYARNAIARQQLEDQEKTVIQDEGTVKADEGSVAYDKVELSYCHIVAPISGKVGLRLVDPGNTVFSGSGSTLVVITQLQPITVVFNVSEDDLPEVQAQLKETRVLEVDAFDRADVKQIAAGKLTSLDNEIDTTTGTVKFRASFDNKDLALFPNQFVNARLLVKTLRGATLVPAGAVQHNGTAAFVYKVASDNSVHVQAITTATSNDTETAVAGLSPGTEIATSGFDRLEDGAHVQVHAGKPAAPKGSNSTAPANGGSSAP